MGRSIRELLVKKDPNPEHCGRNTCLPCKSKVGACLRQGAVYKISCMTCKTEGSRNTVYLGETARTMFDRGEEHIRAMNNMNEESPMVEHQLEAHQNQPMMFRMKPVMYPKTALWHPANEANEIDKHRDCNVINRRREWGKNLPPKLSIEGQEDSKLTEKRKRDHRREGPQPQPGPHQQGPESEAVAEQERKRARVEGGGCQILGYRLWGAILYSLRDAKKGHHQLRIAMQIKIPLIPWGKGHKRKVQTHQQRAII